MKINLIAIVVLHFLTFVMTISTISAADPSIKIDKVGIVPEDSHRLNIQISAQGENVEVGSYGLRYEAFNENEDLLPGLIEKSQYGKRYQEILPIIDNSAADESPKDGTVGILLDTKDWPTGRYVLRVEANNRPASGPYIFDARFIQLVVDKDSSKATVVDTPNIRVLEENASQNEDNLSITIAAEGEGINVGSFYISIQNRPNPDNETLPGFFRVKEAGDREFLNQGTVEAPDANLTDNGVLDENPKKGVFKHTFSTKNWPEGDYRIQVGAHNRPAVGKYIHDSQILEVKIGDAAPLPVSNIESARHQIIYQKENEYACFANLYTLPDGRLNVFFAARPLRSHYDGSGQSHPSLVSDDEGLTWTNADVPSVDLSWKNKEGDLVVASAEGWTQFPISEKVRLENEGKTVLTVNDTTVAVFGGAEAKTSRDGGKTWEIKSIPLPEGCTGLMSQILSASHLVTSKGVRMTAVYGARLDPGVDPEKRKTEVYILRSADDGKTWSCMAMLPDGLFDKSVGFDETTLGEAADGTIIAMMRSTDEDYLWQSNSKDGGVTWDKPTKTQIWGYPADLLTLKDGRMLCLYGYRRDPMGIRGVLSDDNGKTWNLKDELIIRQDGRGLGADLGYPSGVQLNDGSIFLVYYMTTDGTNTHIASSTVPLTALPSPNTK